jgi:hypothetical protein
MTEGVTLIPQINENIPHYRFTSLLKSEHISTLDARSACP